MSAVVVSQTEEGSCFINEDGTEVDLLISDPSKAKEKLDWQAETKLDELVEIMVASDFKKVLEKGY